MLIAGDISIIMQYGMVTFKEAAQKEVVNFQTQKSEKVFQQCTNGVSNSSKQ